MSALTESPSVSTSLGNTVETIALTEGPSNGLNGATGSGEDGSAEAGEENGFAEERQRRSEEKNGA
ncbi:hypothetical protein HDV00_002303, partial [Rhizophlyctis rosea]